MTTNARPCSIADTLGVIGEKYSLLVLREIFFGVRRFDAIALNIGAPRDVLAARLRHLVEAGVLEKVPYSERPPRFEYRPTATPRRPSAGRLRAQLRCRPTTRCRLPRLRPRGKLPLVDPTLHRSRMDHQRSDAEGQTAGPAPDQLTLNIMATRDEWRLAGVHPREDGAGRG
jgi:DNA-binding HxlR family transcriptional regulator